jgi:hypothetical protein
MFENIYSYNTHSSNSDWLKAFKKHQICCYIKFHALLKPTIFFSPIFKNLIPYVTKQGVPMSSFPNLNGD